MIYDLEKSIFFVKKYYEIKSIMTVQRAFKAKFHIKELPFRNCIMYGVRNFEKNGSVTAVHARKSVKSQIRE